MKWALLLVLLCSLLSPPSACAKPTKEQLKLVGKSKKKSGRVQRIPKVYRCEACRVIVEEVERELETLAKEWQNKAEMSGPFDPGNLLDEICNFGKKGKKKYKEMWAGYPRTYRKFCSDFMKEKNNQKAMMKVLSGSRTNDERSRQSGMVVRVKKLCGDALGFCEKDRYQRATGQCDACVKIMTDLDDMLSRSSQRQTADEIADNLSYQCQVLPWRFIDALK
jgi:hypothetical protein